MNINRRLNEHVAAGKINRQMAMSTKGYAVSGNRDSLRVAEQKMINRYGLSNLSNRRNEIAPRNWNRMGVR